MSALTVTFLTSAVVAALVSGLFSYFTSTKVEKLKAFLSNKEFILKKLDAAYQEVANINRHNANFSRSEINNEPESLLKRMIVEHTNLYNKVYHIYVSIKPYLSSESIECLEKLLININHLNPSINELMSNKIENPNERLLKLMEMRQKFGKDLSVKIEMEIRSLRHG